MNIRYYIKKIIEKAKTIFVLLYAPPNVKITGSWFKLYRIKFDIKKTSDVKVKLGFGSDIRNVVFYVRGKGCTVEIGKNVKIKSGIIWLEDDNCSVIVGDSSTVENANFYVTEMNSKIQLGQNCMLAHDIELRTGDSHSIVELATGHRQNPASDIIIGNRVWVGAHAKILKGVKSEDDIIVGLGSIVSSKAVLKGNSLYAGIPAKLIREGLIWKRERL
jgi:acetyltransferase-like isoleucine patch superfamily enzyme